MLKMLLQEKAGLTKDPLYGSSTNGPLGAPVESERFCIGVEEALPAGILRQGCQLCCSPEAICDWSTISRQILLRKKPDNFKQATADATEVELH